jgi:hypothetical protein
MSIFKEMKMKKGTLVSVVLLLAAASLGYTQEPAAGGLHGSVDVTYLSKYVWRGFDIYDDKSAVQPSVNLDLGGGVGVSVMGHRANTSGFEMTGERWDYYLHYSNAINPGEKNAIHYRLGYVYYNYPDMSSHTAGGISKAGIPFGSIDLQELHAIFSLPNILPVKGLVPTYVLVKLWPSNSGTIVGANSPWGGTASGFAHIFMLDYGIPVKSGGTNKPEQVINLHSEVVFNDGVGPNGANVDHDWSNAVFGISTTFDLGGNFSLTPGVYHQVTMDKSVNTDNDETWASVGATYKF